MLAAVEAGLSRKAISRSAHQALNDLVAGHGPDAADRRPLRDGGPRPPSRATRRSSAARCTSCSPTDIGSVEVVNDVTEKELLAAMRGIGLQR